MISVKGFSLVEKIVSVCKIDQLNIIGAIAILELLKYNWILTSSSIDTSGAFSNGAQVELFAVWFLSCLSWFSWHWNLTATLENSPSRIVLRLNIRPRVPVPIYSLNGNINGITQELELL